MEAADKGGLLDEDNLELWLNFYLLNPPEHRGLSLTEIEAMPETRKRDWIYLQGEMARIRKSVRHKKETNETSLDRAQARAKARRRKGRR